MSNAGVINIAGGGGGGAPVQDLTGNSGGPVPPTANNINLLGIGGVTVAGNPGTSTLDISVQKASAQLVSSAANAGIASFSALDFAVDGNGFVTLVGGAAPPAVQKIFVDESSGGGSDPIFSDASGEITITGSLVNFGSHAKAVSTNSATNPNEFTIDVQIANTAVASTRTANGLSHFDSSSFAINTDGFVTLLSTGAGKTITGNTGGTISPIANNWTLVTANTTTKFSGNNGTATITIDYALGNLVLGNSLASVTIGNHNTGLGNGVLNSLTLGSNNVAIGEGTLNHLTTTSQNTGIGVGAMQTLVSQGDNVAIGYAALNAATTGTGRNISIGSLSAPALLTGTTNVLIGYNVASAYTGSESSNILISNIGVVGESNTIRIGTNGSGAGQQNLCYIAGIDGVNVGSVAKVVTEASNQLGTATITAGAGITVTPTANTITIAATAAGFAWNDQTADLNPIVNENGYFADKAASRLVLTLPTNASAGDTYAIAGFGSQGWQVVAGAGQVIHLGNQVTSTNGTLTSTNQWDQLEIVCSPTTTIFIVRYSVGNITVA